MWDMVRRLVWFFIVASVIAYLIFLALGSVIHAQALDASHIVTVRDVLRPGSHDLSGIVMVPRSCAELSVASEQLSTTLYMLRFKTWEEPSVACTDDESARSFRATVFAPAAGVSFQATLDDLPLQLAVIQVPDIQQ